MWMDTIRLDFGHSLIAGNMPDKIAMEKFEESRKARGQVELASFGLFDTAAPNFSNYYPDVTAEDLAPKDADFVYPVFRALSEVVVHKNWNPVDFGQKGILKKSMSLLKGQTLYPNHEAAVGNELGTIADVVWEESYKDGDIIIPAGINAKTKIDGKSHPQIARSIMMDPPAIHSTSVTVQFLWDKSHPSYTEEQFFTKLGTYDKDGTLIRKMATDIKRYNEMSFVSHGADPYAQKINDKGRIVNPNFADVTYKLSAEGVEQKKKQKFYFFDYKEELVSNSTIPDEHIEETSQSENKNNMKKELLMALMAAVGAGITLPLENTDENAEANKTAFLTSLQKLAADKLAADTEVTRLKAIETEYNKDKPMITKATEILSNTRTRVLATYTKTANNKPDAAISALIASADMSALEALEKQYNTQLEEKFPMACKSCGSHQVSRQTAAQEDEGQGEDDNTEQSGEKKLSDFVKNKRRNFKIHEEEQPTK